MFALPKFTWDTDKQLCKSCQHYREAVDTHRDSAQHTIMLCAVNPRRGRRGIGSCIDARTKGPCKDGKLFERRKEEFPLSLSSSDQAGENLSSPLCPIHQVISSGFPFTTIGLDANLRPLKIS